MAKPVTVKGTKVRLLQGNGATPEVFTAFCGLTAKSINFQTNTNETFVPDCDDPDAPQWRELSKSGRYVSISGSGLLNMGSLEAFQAAYDEDETATYRFEIAVPALQFGGHWIGQFMLTNFQITGNDGELTNVEITLESSGEVTWVPAI